MTAARGVALGALVVAVVVVAVVLLRGGGTHTYTLRFQNAGQLVKDDDVQVGGRRVGSVARHQADRRQPGARSRSRSTTTSRRCTRARRRSIRATSLSGIANRYIALTPGPEQPPEARRRRRRSATDKTTAAGRPRPALQHARPEDAQGPAAGHPGLGDAVRRARASRPTRRRKYFNPALSTSARARQRARPRPAGVRATSSSTRRETVTRARRAPRRPRRPRRATRTRPRRRSATRTPRSPQALGLLPDTLRQANTTFVNLRATLDDLDVLVDASKPATKRPRAVLPRAAPARARRAPDDPRPAHADHAARAPNNDLIDLLRKAPQLEQRRRAGVRATRSRRCRRRTPVADVHPALRAGPRRLAPRLRPGRRQLRRQRPLRAHPADLQRLLVRRQPGGRHAHADRRRASASPACRPATSSAARAPPAAAAGRLGAVARHRRHARLRPVAWCRPDHEARRSPSRSSSSPRGVLVVLRAPAPATAAAATTRCARSSTTRSR